MNTLEGTYTALITPFDTQDRLDEQGLEKNILLQLESEIEGIVVLGTTGETPCLSEQEQIRIIQLARQLTDDRMPLIVGTGSYSTRQTIINTRRAKDLGADFALVVTPYYNRPTQEGLYLHFKTVAEAIDIPIILYHVPGRCSTTMTIDTIVKLAEIPGIVGLKESSGNLPFMSEIIEKTSYINPKFSLLSGDDAWTLPCVALGGNGVISVASNLIPREIKTLVDTCIQGNFFAAQEIHHKLQPLFRALFVETNPIPIKLAMNLAGMAAGKCRLPLSAPLPQTCNLLEKLINDDIFSFHL